MSDCRHSNDKVLHKAPTTSTFVSATYLGPALELLGWFVSTKEQKNLAWSAIGASDAIAFVGIPVGLISKPTDSADVRGAIMCITGCSISSCMFVVVEPPFFCHSVRNTSLSYTLLEHSREWSCQNANVRVLRAASWC